MTIGLVTDSTAYLPMALVHSLGIEVVDVHVIVDGVSHAEGDLPIADVLAVLRANRPVTTSRATPEQFATAYRRLQSRGCDSILSVHMSGELSGTYESAVIAARDINLPIEVVDSRGVGMMFGFAVLDVAQAAQSSHVDVHHMAHAVRILCNDSSIQFYVDTLEFLQRSGRISKTQSRVGSALSVKPLLTMVDGKVEQHQLLRTSAKALRRLVDLSITRIQVLRSRGQGYHVAVHHVDAPDRAGLVAQLLCEGLSLSSVQVTPVGAVIAAHVGMGAVAVVVTPTLSLP